MGRSASRQVPGHPRRSGRAVVQACAAGQLRRQMAYLRTQFDHIRAVVPLAAMSAATMMALACDGIVMGAPSQLGPIDPQFTIMAPEGPRSPPGQAIEDQFARAKEECANPSNIAAWLPILRSYAPGLLAMCSHQRALAEQFVARSLARHMLRESVDPEGKPIGSPLVRRLSRVPVTWTPRWTDRGTATRSQHPSPRG